VCAKGLVFRCCCDSTMITPATSPPLVFKTHHSRQTLLSPRRRRPSVVSPFQPSPMSHRPAGPFSFLKAAIVFAFYAVLFARLLSPHLFSTCSRFPPPRCTQFSFMIQICSRLGSVFVLPSSPLVFGPSRCLGVILTGFFSRSSSGVLLSGWPFPRPERQPVPVTLF